MDVKLGFILVSNSIQPFSSTRISVFNILPFLRSANIDPYVVYEPEIATETPDVSGLLPQILSERFDIIYFQKVHGPSAVKLAMQLSDHGIKTVFGVCDVVVPEMARATDATIVVTDYLKSLYPDELHARFHVVHDGIEHPEVEKKEVSRRWGSRLFPLRAVLVTSSHLRALPVIGNPPPWLHVDVVGLYPQGVFQRWREARWKLLAMQDRNEILEFKKFMLNPRIRCHAWETAGVYDKLINADIGIIPIETKPEHEPEPGKIPPSWKIKSENRLTMKMCTGLPVVTTPIPSYEPVIDQIGRASCRERVFRAV